MLDHALNAALIGAIFFAAACLRYLLMTGSYYLLVYKLGGARLRRFKIDPEPPKASDVRHEMRWGLLNNINFALLGVGLYALYQADLLAIYLDLDAYGLLYAIGIIPILLVLHDSYFYWSHYLMHHRRFRKVSHHVVHHQVHNVSPWSAFSVHPVEGFIELLFRPVILMVVPLHPLTIGVFAFITFALNVIGHSGYEFFPRGYATSKLTRLKSCATFHYMHHKDGRYNLGLFLCLWDRLMGTLHPDYEAFYDRVTREHPLRMPERAGLAILAPSTWKNSRRDQPERLPDSQDQPSQAPNPVTTTGFPVVIQAESQPITR